MKEIYKEWLKLDMKTGDIKAVDFMDYLMILDTLNPNDIALVNSKKTPDDKKVELFLSRLPPKGPKGLKDVIRVLQFNNNQTQIDRLKDIAKLKKGINIDEIPVTDNKYPEERKNSLYHMYQEWLLQDMKLDAGKPSINADGLVGYLIQCGIMDENDGALVYAQVPPVAKNSELFLKILPGKVSQVLVEVADWLKHTNSKALQSFIDITSRYGFQLDGHASAQEHVQDPYNPGDPGTNSNPVQLPPNLPLSEAERQVLQKFHGLEIADWARIFRSPMPSGVIQNMQVKMTQNLTEDVQRQLGTDIFRNFSKPKGKMLIINIKKFVREMPERIGTDVDRENLRMLFTKMGYSVDDKNNLPAEKIIDEVKRFAKSDSLQKCDSAVVAVLSHGDSGIIFGSDEKPVSVSDLEACLNRDNCPNLINKPKLFIIQACRGHSKDRGYNEGRTVSDEPRQILNRIPLDLDIVTAYSTTPGFVSWRNEERGSWFVRILCEVFAEEAASLDVLQLLTKVIKRVSEKQTAEGCVSCPQYQTSLSQRFFFFPGYHLP